MPKKKINFKDYAKKKADETIELLCKKWENAGYKLEIDDDVLYIKNREIGYDFIIIDLGKQEIWFDEWIGYDIFNLLCKTLKILDWSKEDE